MPERELTRPNTAKYEQLGEVSPRLAALVEATTRLRPPLVVLVVCVSGICWLSSRTSSVEIALAGMGAVTLLGGLALWKSRDEQTANSVEEDSPEPRDLRAGQ